MATIEANKTILTAHLEDALEQGICPLCFLASETEYRYLDALLYEKMNNGAIRAALARSRGFCRYHTYRMIEIGGYGTNVKLAILYKDLVNAISDEVAALRDKGPAGEPTPEGCPACRAVAETERNYTHVFLTSLEHEEGLEAYRRSFGLCMPHFSRVYGPASRRARAFLKEDQLGRLGNLAHDLGEFIRKSVVKDEVFGDERDSWQRVIHLYAGTPGEMVRKPVRDQHPHLTR
jgi:hypothetical protein